MCAHMRTQVCLCASVCKCACVHTGVLMYASRANVRVHTRCVRVSVCKCVCMRMHKHACVRAYTRALVCFLKEARDAAKERSRQHPGARGQGGRSRILVLRCRHSEPGGRSARGGPWLLVFDALASPVLSQEAGVLQGWDRGGWWHCGGEAWGAASLGPGGGRGPAGLPDLGWGQEGPHKDPQHQVPLSGFSAVPSRWVARDLRVPRGPETGSLAGNVKAG